MNSPLLALALMHFYFSFCSGLKNATLVKSLQMQIVNGVDSGNDRPFYVKVIFGNNFCGGAIVDRSWVITAAHCVAAYRGNRRPVVEISRFSEPGSNLGLLIPTKKAFLHPNFRYTEQPMNDIALVRLRRPLIKGKFEAIALCRESHDHGTFLGTCSMGASSISGYKFPPRLQETFFVETKFQSRDPYDLRLCREDNICTDKIQGFKSSGLCYLDDGAPLFTFFCNSRIANCLYGVASYYVEGSGNSNGCNGYNYFSSVPHLIDWIEDTIYKNS